MKTNSNPMFRYRRLGTMTYSVESLATGATLGTVWREMSGGWSAKTESGRIVVNDSPLSREGVAIMLNLRGGE